MVHKNRLSKNKTMEWKQYVYVLHNAAEMLHLSYVILQKLSDRNSFLNIMAITSEYI